MPKKKAGEPRRELTKRQLSRWQQQRRRQRIIFSVGIFIIVAVLGIIGGGWYLAEYQPRHQVVMRVNDVEFNMDYYVKMLSYYARGQSAQYMQAVADNILEIIKRTELIRQGALGLGISVSDDEVDEKLKSFDPPLSEDYRDIVAGQMLYDKMRAEYFDKQVPVFAEQRHIMAMLLESESQAAEVRARLEEGEDFAELASELSLDSYTKTEGADLGWLPKGILPSLLNSSVPEEYAFSTEVGVLSQPVPDKEVRKGVGYWLVKLLDRDEIARQALVRVILLGSEEEAQKAKARLDAGEDFVALVEELSQDEKSKENEGQLDITSPDMVGEEFGAFVFDPETEPGAVSEPIREDDTMTKGGYWLIKVLGADDNRRIEDEDREMLKTIAFNDWVKGLLDNPENKVEVYLTDEQKAWAAEHANVDQGRVSKLGQ